MSDNIIALPDRLPEGWEPSSMFADAVIRKVSTRPALRPEDAIYEVHGPDAIRLLVVERLDDGRFRAMADHDDAGTWASRYEAMMAAERAYCCATVRRE